MKKEKISALRRHKSDMKSAAVSTNAEQYLKIKDMVLRALNRVRR